MRVRILDEGREAFLPATLILSEQMLNYHVSLKGIKNAMKVSIPKNPAIP
jgi:exoribonuclease II